MLIELFAQIITPKEYREFYVYSEALTELSETTKPVILSPTGVKDGQREYGRKIAPTRLKIETLTYPGETTT